VVLWLKGHEVLRVTGRKDMYGEVEEFICNECRFEKKDLKHWTVEGPRKIDRHSVISGTHYTLPVIQDLVPAVPAMETSTASAGRLPSPNGGGVMSQEDRAPASEQRKDPDLHVPHHPAGTHRSSGVGPRTPTQPEKPPTPNEH
jgi:hypothetical protein